MATPKHETAGQPKKFNSVDEVIAIMDKYFNDQDVDKMTPSAWFMNGEELEFRPTMSGLAMALNVSRQTLVNYSYKEEYFDTIRKARDIVQTTLEQRLYGNNVTGLIFNLKNNFGWADKSDVAITSPDGSMTPKFTFNPVGSND
jgi:hypothetical protein|tara:strand:- start:938 stop:1369 length:432 start_codon:yes stop_codon:yes gene_type:complete